MKTTSAKVKVNLSPSNKEIRGVEDMQIFVDQLILIMNDTPDRSVFGPDFFMWRWAVVNVDGGFQFPVPICREGNRMKLFSNGKPYEFTIEEAAIVLAACFFSHFDILKCSQTTGQKLSPFLGYPLLRAINWEDRMGGYVICRDSYDSLMEFLRTDDELCLKSFQILD